MHVLRTLLFTSCLIVAGCGGSGRACNTSGCPAGDAIAVLVPSKGSTVNGTVRFLQEAKGVRVVVAVRGFAPNTTHAFHIHEFGDLTATDGSSAGAHYNPGGHQHGGPESAAHHAGDLGNLVADAKGNATLDRLVADLSICGGSAPVLGRSVVIHDKADDFTSQPAGNAGARIAVGVIGIAKAAEAVKPVDAKATDAKPVDAKAKPAAPTKP